MGNENQSAKVPKLPGWGIMILDLPWIDILTELWKIGHKVIRGMANEDVEIYVVTPEIHDERTIGGDPLPPPSDDQLLRLARAIMRRTERVIGFYGFKRIGIVFLTPNTVQPALGSVYVTANRRASAVDCGGASAPATMVSKRYPYVKDEDQHQYAHQGYQKH